MSKEDSMWRTALITLAAVALLAIGLGVIVYVGLARNRIMPTPTPLPRTATLPVPTVTPTLAGTSPPMMTVVGNVRAYSPGALFIVLEPIEGTVEQIIVTAELRVVFANGGGASVADIVPGQVLMAEGPLDALGRMVARQITIIEQARTPTAPLPTHTPTPETTPTHIETATITPTPSVPDGAWKGEYYNNRSLAGSPTLVRLDPTVDFQWQQSSPAPVIRDDSFSVRWQGRWGFEEGGYRFFAYADDGVRVWVDDVMVIDQWRNQAATMVYGDLYLRAGTREVRVEYYEATGNAQVRVWWEHQGLYPDWKGEYFGNPYLSGNPVTVRNDTETNFDWGKGSPDPQVPADNFSARWTRILVFAEGAYRFNAKTDDGVRLWVDGARIINEWHQEPLATHVGHIWLDSGPHQVRVEYFEGAGNAAIQVWWEKITTFKDWRGEYFANPDLAGRPAFVRNDESIGFGWGLNSPGSGLPADNFSVRWSRMVELQKGRYRFWAVADDGVRITVDSSPVIVEWHDSSGMRYERELVLEGGRHSVSVEYYERSSQASVQAGWDLLPALTPTLTPSLTPTSAPSSPTPTGTSTALPPTPTPTSAPSSPTPTGTSTALPSTPTSTPAPSTPTATGTSTPTLAPSTPTATGTSTPTLVPSTPTSTHTPSALMIAGPGHKCVAIRPLITYASIRTS